MSEQIAFNCDCMEYMKTIPDKYFDLAVADPPYGGGASANAEDTFNGAISGRFGGRFEKYLKADTVNAKNNTDEIGAHFVGRGRSKKYADKYSQSLNVERERERESDAPIIKASRTGGTWSKKYQGGAFSGSDVSVHRSSNPGGNHRSYPQTNDIRNWDIAPSSEYFAELARISKNQIIWGGNYFALPPTRCFLIWRKLTISENFTMAMAEYAWTSFNDNAKVFDYPPQDKERFHPTQKPVALYEWILKRYAKQGDKIFDSHLGSGSSRIAAYNLDLDFVGCEIDKTYFDLQEKRWAEHISQERLEIPTETKGEQQSFDF